MRIAFSRRSVMVLVGLAFASLLSLAWSAMQDGDTVLAIRATDQRVSVPDGFSVLHHLDAHGIAFKSITPQDNQLVIKFDTSAQRDAAQRVLYLSLPQGFIIAKEDDQVPTPQWIQRLRGDGHRVG